MTNASFGSDLGILALVWLACWGASFLLIRRGITYISNPVITSLLFLSCSIPLVALYRPRLEPLLRPVTASSLAVLALAAALTLAVYVVAPRFLRRPGELIQRHPAEFYLRLEYRYLLPKSCEVLFQQVFMAVLTTTLAATGLRLTGVVLAFLAIFGVLHLPMLGVVGKRVGVAYGIASVTLAAAFPLLILRVPSGIVYSYTAHWFFYTVVALSAWVASARAPKPRT